MDPIEGFLALQPISMERSVDMKPLTKGMKQFTKHVITSTQNKLANYRDEAVDRAASLERTKQQFEDASTTLESLGKAAKAQVDFCAELDGFVASSPAPVLADLSNNKATNSAICTQLFGMKVIVDKMNPDVMNVVYSKINPAAPNELFGFSLLYSTGEYVIGEFRPRLHPDTIRRLKTMVNSERHLCSWSQFFYAVRCEFAKLLTAKK